MRVLVVTRSDDVDTAARVARELSDCGADVYRLDTDRFPTDERVGIALAPAACETELHLNGRRLLLSEVDAVWYRQFDAGSGLPESMDEGLRYSAVLESRAMLFGLLESLEVYCLDPLANVRRAENKELQLRLARRHGLDIPRTLITNDAAALRAFAKDSPGGVVAKMLQPPRLRGKDKNRVLYTQPVTDEVLERADSLRLCPMVFQERLAAMWELRVTIVGRHTFTAELEHLSGSEVDWRRDAERVATRWRATELPDDVGDRLRALLDELGLDYGAIDMIQTRDGRLVFLEVNPGGQYRWLEEHAALPISAAIAEVLTSPSARRAPARPGVLDPLR